MGFLTRTTAFFVKWKSTLTGAVTRLLQYKLEDMVSIEDFRDPSDPDDTLSIQRAVDSGASVITCSAFRRRNIQISDSIKVTKDNVYIDFHHNEVNMTDPSGLKQHFYCKKLDGSQLASFRLRACILTNTFASTVDQIYVEYGYNVVIERCTGYSTGNVNSFIQLYKIIEAYVRNNKTEGMKNYSFWGHGSGAGINRSVDNAVYDNRFVGGKWGIRFSDWYEGAFVRRNIIYAQKTVGIIIDPSTKQAALGSIKLQDNDLDSPEAMDYFIFIQFATNVQITGCWFAGGLCPICIRLEQTDAVIISTAQAYPVGNFLLDNGVGTTLVSNMIVGGTTAVYFGVLAARTMIATNHFRGMANAVNTDGHSGGLSIISNLFDTTADAIVGLDTANTEKATILYNTGDNKVGITTSGFVQSTSFSITTGGRPEAVSLRKATGVTSISINDVEIHNSADGVCPLFVGLGTLPPRTKLSISFNAGNAPWLNRTKC